MKTTILIMLFLSIILLNGCKDKKQDKTLNLLDSTFTVTPTVTNNYYFAGKYQYQTNKATLEDQATGSTLTINNGEIANKLEKQYLALKLHDGKYVSVQLLGHLTPTNKIGHASTNHLTVTQIISLHPETNTRIPQLTGNYITYVPNNIKPTELFTFSLHPDYTYTFSINNLSANSSRNATGKWFLLNTNEIQFSNNTLANFKNEAFINDDGTQLTFKFSKRIYYKQE
ncbi:MAG TPA: hypothetical protein H9796_12980 [Candidatus Butyricimonas faecavium]|nr:hypothetical protein [Candidatus Butyricimonas faecavium]